MSLFSITRYEGDETEEAGPESSQAYEILQKINAEVKRKRKLLQNVEPGDVDYQDKKNTKGKSEGTADENFQDYGATSSKDSEKHSSRKKKRKKKEVEDVDPATFMGDIPAVDTNQDCKETQDELISIVEPLTKLQDNADDKIATVDLQETDLSVDRYLMEIGGFTVMQDLSKKKTQKVHRVLPRWLTEPTVFTQDLNNQLIPLDQMAGLDKDTISLLQKNGIESFFPVQQVLIPKILDGVRIELAGYRPCDICCSAPTGSGKTLAFVLPIVQALKTRVVCRLRVLVVLPVKDLALQVYNVFNTYCVGTQLKVCLVTGQRTFTAEQQLLVKHSADGTQNLVDILVATPGRLVDHLQQTHQLDLSHLRFLVMDEADRTMDQIQQDWLSRLEQAIYPSSVSNPHIYNRAIPGPLIAASCGKPSIPLQKLLFSATLSQNPEKLQQLNLFQPQLFTSVIQQPAATPSKTSPIEESLKAGEFAGKYTTPVGLEEYFMVGNVGEQPLIMLYLLHHHGYRHVLCFTNSLEATHRLYWLVKLYGGITVKEFSSRLPMAKRTKMLKEFEADKIDLLICSDAMARGMDVEKVQYVISYEAPRYIKTYIHRIGRTARAGRTGTAITMLSEKEVLPFKKMLNEADKSHVMKMNVEAEDLLPMVEDYKAALAKLPGVLKQGDTIKHGGACGKGRKAKHH